MVIKKRAELRKLYRKTSKSLVVILFFVSLQSELNRNISMARI